MRREVFRIQYPETKAAKSAWNKTYGLNAYYAGKPWAQRKRDADFWHWKTLEGMIRDNVEQKPFDGPVSITFDWNDNMDIDNHAVIGKMIVDALKGRLLADDDKKHYISVTHRFYSTMDAIMVTIKEEGTNVNEEG